MSDTGATTRKARAEVDNVIDEVVLTIENGVSHPDGAPGFEAQEAERLRVRLRRFAETIVGAARGRPSADLDAAVDAVVDTIREGVIHPPDSAGFGAGEADELRASLRTFAEAILIAARDQTRTHTGEPIDGVVRTIRSGLFHVYGRASFAAITADQLEAYLQTFVDAALTVIEREDTTEGTPAARPRATPA